MLVKRHKLGQAVCGAPASVSSPTAISSSSTNPLLVLMPHKGRVASKAYFVQPRITFLSTTSFLMLPTGLVLIGGGS